jgi:alcohol dehydrogenase
MKAAICLKHGKTEGLQIKEIEKPSIKKDEILVKIVASTVTSGDVVLRKQSILQFLLFWPLARLLFGVRNQRKKILGHEFSGIVETVGNEVTKFKKGDSVFGTTGFKGGAHAEYISISEKGIIAIKPENLSFEEATALPIGGICALHLLKKLTIQSGDKVLIYGASGSIGTYAVQLAKYFEAEVTGVCSSTNIELVKSLGADAVLDYTKQDVLKTDKKYDAIFDTVGKFPKYKAKKLLKENGRYVSTHSSPIEEKQEYLQLLKELALQGIIKPVVDKTYTLDSIQQAHTYVDTGRKKGNIVINMNP